MRSSRLLHPVAIALTILGSLAAAGAAYGQVRSQFAEDAYQRFTFFRRSNKTYHKLLGIAEAKRQYADMAAQTLAELNYRGLGEAYRLALRNEAEAIHRANLGEIDRVRSWTRNLFSLVFGTDRKVYDTERAIRVMKLDQKVQDAIVERSRVENEVVIKLAQSNLADRFEQGMAQKLEARPLKYPWRPGKAGATKAPTTVAQHDALIKTDETSARIEKAAARRLSPGPWASIAADPGAGDVPLKVAFSGAASKGTDDKDTDLDFTWDLGDGQKSGAVALSHEYKKPGSYKVTLLVKDKNDALDSESRTITVAPVPVTLVLLQPAVTPPTAEAGGKVVIGSTAAISGFFAGEKAEVQAVLSIAGQRSSEERQTLGTGIHTFTFPPFTIPEEAKDGEIPIKIEAWLDLPEQSVYTHTENKLESSVTGAIFVGKAGPTVGVDAFAGLWEGSALARGVDADGRTLTKTVKLVFRLEVVDARTVNMVFIEPADEPACPFQIAANTGKHSSRTGDAAKEGEVRKQGHLVLLKDKITGSMSADLYSVDSETKALVLDARVDSRLVATRVKE